MGGIVYHNTDGVKRTMHVESGDRFHIATEADMTEVVESVKIDRELQDLKSPNRVVARVPMTVYEQSMLEGWDEGDWKKWLNDPDNAAFRVWQGRV